MNSKQRVVAALEGNLPDRVPVFLLSRRYSMKAANVSFKTCLEDTSGEKYARAQADLWRLYGYDGVIDFGGVNAESAAFGSELTVSENESPSIDVPLLQDLEDIEHLEVPEITRIQPIIRQLNVVKNLKKYVGPEVPVFANVQCSFRSAAMLRGLNNLLIDLYENPDEIHKLLEKTTQMAMLYGRELVACGCDVLTFSNPTASGSVISRKHYQEFVFPNDKKMLDFFRDIGVLSILHICGDVSDRLDLIAETGYHGISVDSVVDLAYARKKVGNRVCLIGNVDVFEPLRRGTPEQVMKAAINCIRTAGTKGRYLLSAGCEVIPDTPEENLSALVNGAKQWDYQTL
jgi:uroporphyrinogen decarboxylase